MVWDAFACSCVLCSPAFESHGARRANISSFWLFEQCWGLRKMLWRQRQPRPARPMICLFLLQCRLCSVMALWTRPGPIHVGWGIGSWEIREWESLAECNWWADVLGKGSSLLIVWLEVWKASLGLYVRGGAVFRHPSPNQWYDSATGQDSQTCFLAAKLLNRQLDSASDFRLATDRWNLFMKQCSSSTTSPGFLVCTS